MNNVMPLTYVANIYYTLHYCWYILLLMVHTANINYSLVIIHILLNHCPGITWLCTLALPLSPQLFKFPSLLLISLLPSFHLTYKQEFHECFFLLKGCVLHVTGPSPFPPLNKHIYKHTIKHRKGKAVEQKRQVAEKEHSKASETAEKIYQTKQKDGGG